MSENKLREERMEEIEEEMKKLIEEMCALKGEAENPLDYFFIEMFRNFRENHDILLQLKEMGYEPLKDGYEWIPFMKDGSLMNGSPVVWINWGKKESVITRKVSHQFVWGKQ